MAHDENTTPRPTAVRLENYRDEGWQVFVHQRLWPRYPNAKIVSRRPQVALVALGMTSAWTDEDEAFFGEMRSAGYYQRWETLAELPPKPRKNAAIFEHISYRVAEGEPLTPAQSKELVSQLHSLEYVAEGLQERLEREQRQSTYLDEERRRRDGDWSAVVAMLDSLLGIDVGNRGAGEGEWIAEDPTTGKILARAKDIADMYGAVLKQRLE